MIVRGIILITSLMMLLVGLVTTLTPGLNNIFLPIEANDLDSKIMVRSIAGLFIGIAYLSVRFVFSSSRVQIGNVLLSLTLCGLFSKIFSFIFDGFTNYSLGVFLFMSLYALGLYYLQKKRKNQLDYNL
ncbi:MAG: hypothetical protein CBD86_00370 [Gammaproteobacteria bacterium TMED226]|nr:MAG: hypothetical protein CBD86_00370 [Gammaproteobacteria bacterium TMED226]|tara:strand:- start:99 stop:485 length:387 start_codon:yes stop_codon:yes gene_type:complete